MPARPPTCNVSALSRSTRDKFRYFAWPRIVTGADRSESRKVGKKGGERAQWGEENRIVPWKQGFLCVPPDGIKLILSLS